MRRLWKEAVKRWVREARRLELLRFRQRWADKFGEYECVGGPLDGITRPCVRRGVVMAPGGYYSVDPKDCRLHFHIPQQQVSSWGRE